MANRIGSSVLRFMPAFKRHFSSNNSFHLLLTTKSDTDIICNRHTPIETEAGYISAHESIGHFVRTINGFSRVVRIEIIDDLKISNTKYKNDPPEYDEKLASTTCL